MSDLVAKTMKWSFGGKHNGVIGGMVYLGQKAAVFQDFVDLHAYLKDFPNYHVDRVKIDFRSTCGKKNKNYTTAGVESRKNDPKRTVVFG